MDRSTTINGVKFTNEQIITLQNIDYFADKHNQDKIKFTVEQLDLLKSQIIEWRKLYKGKFSEFSNGVNDALYDVEEEIDNQIKELKGVKNE